VILRKDTEIHQHDSRLERLAENLVLSIIGPGVLIVLGASIQVQLANERLKTQVENIKEEILSIKKAATDQGERQDDRTEKLENRIRTIEMR
jgi:hypothetical protein